MESSFDNYQLTSNYSNYNIQSTSNTYFYIANAMELELTKSKKPLKLKCI